MFLERVWAIASIVVAIGAVVIAVAAFSDGETRGGIISLVIAAVAVLFNRVGWSGRGTGSR